MNKKLSRRQDQSTVSNLDAHLGYWLRFVSNHVSYAFARRIEQSSVTVAEWVLLREMFDAGSFAPSELSKSTGLTRGAISKLIDRLVNKGLASRVDRTDDRRYQTVALTDTGRKLIPKLAALADENDAEFFQALSAKERQVLIATMKKLVEANGLTRKPTE